MLTKYLPVLRDCIYVVMVIILNIILYRTIPFAIQYGKQYAASNDNLWWSWLVMLSVLMMGCVVIHNLTGWFAHLASTLKFGYEVWGLVIWLFLLGAVGVALYDSPKQTVLDWVWLVASLIAYVAVAVSGSGVARLVRNDDGSYTFIAEKKTT